ncbi:hypothetical protein HMPREF1517_1565 [Streptococcus sp. ACS2]|nr:hypothetical protein HMPREF1517_1565 [Streptococcus sp. ACS2]
MGKFSLFLASILVLINLKVLRMLLEISVVGYFNFYCHCFVLLRRNGLAKPKRFIIKTYLVLMVLL